MQTLIENTAGLRLVINLNWDRLVYALTLALALGLGAWGGSLLLPG